MPERLYVETVLADGERARVWVGETDGREWAVIEAHGLVTFAPLPGPRPGPLPAPVAAALGEALAATAVNRPV